MAPDPPKHLTFGIEFEFLAPAFRRRADPDPEDGRWIVPHGTVGRSIAIQTFVLRKLEELNLPVLAECDLAELIPSIMGSREADTVKPPSYIQSRAAVCGLDIPSGVPAEHRFWRIMHDVTVEPKEEEDPPDYLFTGSAGMELVSPILEEENSAGFEQMEKVYAALRNSMRIHVNTTAGLHVHVGCDHYSLLDFRKLATLVVLVEPKLTQLCAPWRRQCPWSLSVRDFSRAALLRKDGSDPRDTPSDDMKPYLPTSTLLTSELATLNPIWNAANIWVLSDELLTPGNSPTPDYFSCRAGFAIRGDYKGTDIEGAVVKASMTCEWRYRESTGNPKDDYEWVRVVMALVKAGAANPKDFQQLITSLYEADSVEGFLTLLRLDDSIPHWRNKISDYNSEAGSTLLADMAETLTGDNMERGLMSRTHTKNLDD